MTSLGIPVPTGFTITTEACRAYMKEKQLPDGLEDEVAEHLRLLEERAGKRFGDPADPLLVSVRSGAAVSMPGMMDTILNVGLDDAAAGGLRRGGKREVRERLVPPPDPDVRRDRRRCRPSPLRAGAHAAEARARRQPGRRAHGRGSRVSRRHVPGDLRAGRRRAVSAGRERAADPRRRRRLRVVGDATRAGLPARARHPGRPRHGREHRADGLRQQGGALGHRRLLHAQPVDRRGGPVRRVPRGRAGRGRRRRHPDSRAARAHGRAATRRVLGAPRDDDAAGGALPRYAGHRVHRRGRPAVHPPDAHREAHGGGRAEGRRRHGGRGPDHAGGGRCEDRPRAARPAAPSDDRSRASRSRWPPRGSTPHPARPPARSSSIPASPRSSARPARP